MTPTPERRYPRVAARLRCTWTVATGLHVAEVSNLGLGGCRVDTPQLPPVVGQEVTLTIDLPSGELGLAGKVSWVQGGRGFGVAFVSLPAAQRAQLKAFLISQLPAGG